MGYASQTSSADMHLKEKIQQAIMALVDPIITAGTGNNYELAKAFVARPHLGVEAIHSRAKAVGITVESTDAQLDSAIANAGTIAMLKVRYGLS